MDTANNQNLNHEKSNSGPEVFFDGDCPLCSKEINLLRKLDRKNNVIFTDIAAPAFNAEDYGKTQDDFMDEIHGRTPEGVMITGVEVFRQLYTAVGFGWMIPVTRLPLIRQFLDLGYRLFARNRLRFTGRCKDKNSCSVQTVPTR